MGSLFHQDDAPASMIQTWQIAFADCKQEDVSIVCGSKASSSGVSLYAVADGHNGKAAAAYVRAALPGELERQLGVAPPGGHSPDSVARGLARAFVAVDEAVCRRFPSSGCTLTAAVVSGDVVTLANVGDSTAVLDTGAEVVELSCSHRIGDSPGERARLEAAGGHLARLNEYASGPSTGVHEGLGPVRLWPGGIMVGRAVGDANVGPILLAAPHIRQVRIPPAGARLCLASDGLWDAMPAGRVARLLRQHPSPKGAAMQAVSAAACSRGGLLTDDVTVAVVDLLPPGTKGFDQVLAQFQRRITTVLSDPMLASLALEEAASLGGSAAPLAAGRPGADQQASKAKPRGLFRCFSRPEVLDDLPAEPSARSGRARSSCDAGARNEASARSGRARGGGDWSAYSGRGPSNGWSAYSGRGPASEFSARGGRADFSARSGRADFSARSGRADLSARSGISLRGGSERSVRGGVAREPSLQSCRLATSVEVLWDVDTALWSPADFGRPPRLSSASAGGASVGSEPAGRYSPRSLLEAYSLGSVSTESIDDMPLPPSAMPAEVLGAAGGRLARTLSQAAVAKLPLSQLGAPPISRKNSAPALFSDKKSRGGNAAALLLQAS